MGAANSYEENEHFQNIISNSIFYDQIDYIKEMNDLHLNKTNEFHPICSEVNEDQQECRSTQEATDDLLSNECSQETSDSKQVEYTFTQNSIYNCIMYNFDANRENNEAYDITANICTLNEEDMCNQSEVDEFSASSSMSIRNAARIIYCLCKLSNKSEITKERIEISEEFNEPKFKSYDIKVVRSGLFSTSSPCFIFDLEFQQKKMRNMQIKIEKLLRYMYEKIECQDDILLFMLAYIKRIVMTAGVVIGEANWRPIVFTAFFLAAKYTYDCWYKTKDYATLMEIFSVQEINTYERNFLNAIDFKLFVSIKDIKRLVRYSNQVCTGSRRNSNNRCDKLLQNFSKTQNFNVQMMNAIKLLNE